MTCECCYNWNSWSFGDQVLHHPKWIQCDLLKPTTLSLSSHTIQLVNNIPWRHWTDPQTSQLNKCSDIFRKCPTGTKLRIALKIQGKIITPLEPPHRAYLIKVWQARRVTIYRVSSFNKPLVYQDCSRVDPRPGLFEQSRHVKWFVQRKSQHSGHSISPYSVKWQSSWLKVSIF